MRLPSASPSAVRLPLELTGNPCSRPVPTLQTPSARNSALASIRWPWRAANVRAVSTLSEKATIAMPAAGITSADRSAKPIPGSPGVGSPLGISPITRIPLRSSENTATTAVASRIAIRGPGSRGASRASASSTTSTAADNAIVGQCTPPSPLMNDRTWSTNSSPSTETPVTLPSWLADHDDRDTGHVADQHRPGQQVGQKTDAHQAGDETDRADEQRHRGRQRGVAAAGHPRASGANAVAVISAVVDSGPDRQLPRRAEHRVDGQRHQRRPQPDDRRQPRHRRIRHHLRDQVGRDGHPGQHVAAQPCPLISAELR